MLIKLEKLSEINEIINNLGENEYLIHNCMALGDWIVQYLTLECILKKHKFKYHIIMKEEYVDLVNIFYPHINIYYFTFRHEIVSKYVFDNFENNNKVLLCHYREIKELSSIDFVNQTPFKDVVPSLDDFNFKKNEKVVNDLFCRIKFPKEKTIIVALTSPNWKHKSFEEYLEVRIIYSLLLSGYNVISVAGDISILNNKFMNLAYKITPYELLNLIASVKCVICVDTGPMHMSALAKVPFCSFFKSTNPVPILDYARNSTFKNYEVHDLRIIDNGDSSIIKIIKNFVNKLNNVK